MEELRQREEVIKLMKQTIKQGEIIQKMQEQIN